MQKSFSFRRTNETLCKVSRGHKFFFQSHTHILTHCTANCSCSSYLLQKIRSDRERLQRLMQFLFRPPLSCMPLRIWTFRVKDTFAIIAGDAVLKMFVSRGSVVLINAWMRSISVGKAEKSNQAGG